MLQVKFEFSLVIFIISQKDRAGIDWERTRFRFRTDLLFTRIRLDGIEIRFDGIYKLPGRGENIFLDRLAISSEKPRGKIGISGGAVMFSFLRPGHIRWNIDRFTREFVRRASCWIHRMQKNSLQIWKGRRGGGEQEREKRIRLCDFGLRLRLDFARKFDISQSYISLGRVDIPSLVEISRIRTERKYIGEKWILF